MPDIYEFYSSLTMAHMIEHEADVKRTCTNFRLKLIPKLEKLNFQVKDGNWLEFGAGWGRNIKALELLGFRSIRGIDISKEQVELSKKLGVRSIDLVEEGRDLTELYGRACFDGVLAIDVIEHLSIEQIQAFALQFRRVIKSNGLIVIQVPNDLAPFNPVPSGDITHRRAFTASSLKQIFALFGAEMIFVEGMPFPGSGIVYRLRNVLVSVLLRPLIWFLSVLLYGNVGRVYIEPNLIAVGQVTSKGSGDANCG